MELGRKGILFTFLAVVIAALLATLYSSFQITPLDSSVPLEKIRVTATNQYLINVISYSENSLRISGYRGLQEMIDSIWGPPIGYFSDSAEVNDTFREVVLNGTINGVTRSNMENFTIVELMDRVQNVSLERLGINLTYNISDVWIDQDQPFSVKAYMNISFYVRNENVQWNITNTTISSITIEGLKDPLYYKVAVNSSFKATNTLPQKFNTTTFEIFVNESRYIVSPFPLINITGVGEFRPMSFFGRLTNDSMVKNSNTLTLLSIVSPARVEAETGTPPAPGSGNQIGTTSYVDFIYGTNFSAINCQSILKKVNGTTNQAIVDRHHLQLLFNLTGDQIYDTDTC